MGKRYHTSRKARAYHLMHSYGLTVEQYDDLLIGQTGRCACCGELLLHAIHVDHEHVKGYAKLPPEEKRKVVRGLLCWHCNSFRVAKNTPDTARMVLRYLLAHQTSREGLAPAQTASPSHGSPAATGGPPKEKGAGETPPLPPPPPTT